MLWMWVISVDRCVQFWKQRSFKYKNLNWYQVNSNYNHGQKVLTHLSKTNAFYRCPSIISKSIFSVDSQPPSPPFQCCNALHGHFHLVTTLKRGEGVEMSKLDTENSLVEQNGFFLESVSTTFVHDCEHSYLYGFISFLEWVVHRLL